MDAARDRADRAGAAVDAAVGAACAVAPADASADAAFHTASGRLAADAAWPAGSPVVWLAQWTRAASALRGSLALGAA